MSMVSVYCQSALSVSRLSVSYNSNVDESEIILLPSIVNWSGDGSSAAVSKQEQFRSPYIACVFQKRHYTRAIPSELGS